jgi:FlaA1/EpsC-like NDP-sugar epimerase
MDWLDWIAMISIIISYVAVIVFIVINHWKIDWRHNPWGRHVMRFSYTYVGLLSLALAARFFGQYPGRKVAITIFYVALAAVLTERVWLTLRELHKRKAGARS